MVPLRQEPAHPLQRHGQGPHAGPARHRRRAVCAVLCCVATGAAPALAPRTPRPRLLKTSLPRRLPRPAVRIGYPCFGPPRRVGGKIVGYPAYGRWRVHNLFVNVYQRAPEKGLPQPYVVTQVYRF